MKLSCLNRYLVFVSSFITLSTFSSVIYANGDYLIRQGLQELVQRANFDKAEEFITRASKEHPNFKLAKFLEAELYTAMLGKEVAVREKSIAVDGPIEKQLSVYNYFIKCVIEMGIFPTQNQFIIWLSKTVANRENNPCDTLPKYICRFVNSLFQNYEIPMGEGFTKFTPAQFSEITKASMREIDRIAIENV